MHDRPQVTTRRTGRIDRRRLLQTLGGVSALGLAGCLSGDDNGSDDDTGDDNGDDNGDSIPGAEYEPPPESEWPEHVSPGTGGLGATPPENATILWDGDTATLDDWEHSGVSPLGGEDGADAEWIEHDEYFEINSGTGDIRPEESLGDCHLHLEWRVPEEINGESPVNGNSGVFMMERYEVQVQNDYNRDGTAGNEVGAYFTGDPTLVKPIRPPGEWQEYDILWRGPRFEDGELQRYPMLTVFFNGVCVKNHYNVPGPNWAGILDFDDPQHGHHTDENGNYVEEAPFYLQDHQEEFDIVHYRNIWYYDLPERPVEIDTPDDLPVYDSSHGDEYPDQIDPGGFGTTGDAPADADVLINDEITLSPGDGDWQSDETYGDCQVHVEWQVPEDVEAMGPYRGNSGIAMLGEYEIQILDNYDNPTEAEEWAGAYTGQSPPHHDAVRASGEWQALDVVFQGPRFDGDEVTRPAQTTALLNGVAVQTRLQIEGPNVDGTVDDYERHSTELPLHLLEAETEVNFRNTWVRSLN